MDSSPIADAIAKATPNVAQLLDRHAKWCAQMCRNVPSPRGEKFRNVPSPPAPAVAQTARIFPDVPESSEMFHRLESGGTNPPVYTPRQRPLTYRQLACARLVVRGHGTMEIAAHLGVEHHTIARWKRNPSFIPEVERLRA
jgi:DNA-binding CsgD family transcriptional regulator